MTTRKAKLSLDQFNAMPKRLQFEITYGTSRSRDTYGYNTITVTQTGSGKKWKAMGGGYDMFGTTLGNMMQDLFDKELNILKGHTGFYGFRLSRDGKNYALDGACGSGCMEDVLRNLLGYDIEYQYKLDSKGRADYRIGFTLIKHEVPKKTIYSLDQLGKRQDILNLDTKYSTIRVDQVDGLLDNNFSSLKYFLRMRNPFGKYVARLAHSNAYFLEKIPAKLIKELQTSLDLDKAVKNAAEQQAKLAAQAV